MNTDPDTYLQNIIESAQVGMPDGLKRKLLAIPLTGAVPLWQEIIRVLPQILVGMLLAIQAFSALPGLFRLLRGFFPVTVSTPATAIVNAGSNLWNQALQIWTAQLRMMRVPEELALAYFATFIILVTSAIVFGLLYFRFENQAEVFCPPGVSSGR